MGFGGVQLIYVLTMALGAMGSLVGIIINSRSQAKIQSLTAQLQQRQASGSIETSDARTVWDQINRALDDARRENQRLQQRIDQLEARVAK